MSGTSMAAAHVAGLIAYLISLDGNTTPGTMVTKLQTLARRNALIGIRTSIIALLFCALSLWC
jgi:cerevisin